MKQLVHLFKAFGMYTWILVLAELLEMANNLEDLFLQEQSEIRKFAFAIPSNEGIKHDSDHRGQWLLNAGLNDRKMFTNKIVATCLAYDNIRWQLPRDIMRYAGMDRDLSRSTPAGRRRSLEEAT